MIDHRLPITSRKLLHDPRPRRDLPATPRPRDPNPGGTTHSTNLSADLRPRRAPSAATCTCSAARRSAASASSSAPKRSRTTSLQLCGPGVGAGSARGQPGVSTGSESAKGHGVSTGCTAHSRAPPTLRLRPEAPPRLGPAHLQVEVLEGVGVAAQQVHGVLGHEARAEHAPHAPRVGPARHLGAGGAGGA